jgi:hypothetical protein
MGNGEWGMGNGEWGMGIGWELDTTTVWTHLMIPRPKLLLHAPPFRALQVGHERRESPLSLDTKTGLEVVLSENLVVSFVSRSRFTVRCSLVSSGRGVAGRGTREEGRGIRWSVGVGLCDYEIEEGCPGRAASGQPRGCGN